MTRKDYIILAEVIKELRNSTKYIEKIDPETMLRFFENDLMKVLKKDNSRFDEDKFIKACGIPNNLNK